MKSFIRRHSWQRGQEESRRPGAQFVCEFASGAQLAFEFELRSNTPRSFAVLDQTSAITQVSRRTRSTVNWLASD